MCVWDVCVWSEGCTVCVGCVWSEGCRMCVGGVK